MLPWKVSDRQLGGKNEGFLGLNLKKIKVYFAKVYLKLVKEVLRSDRTSWSHLLVSRGHDQHVKIEKWTVQRKKDFNKLNKSPKLLS